MKVTIIGAGVQGITTAYYLQQRGCDVSVVERCDAAGLESSFGNGGGLTGSAPEPWNAPGIHKVLLRSLGEKDAPILLRPGAIPGMMTWGIRFLLASRKAIFVENIKRNSALANYSVSLMKNIRANTKIDYRFSDSGMLLVFRDQASLDAHMEHASFLKQDCDVENTPLDRKEMIALEPSLRPVQEQLAGAIYFPGDEAGDCHLFCKHLGDYLAVRGVQFHYGLSVSKIKRAGSLFELCLDDGEKLKSDVLVVAAGAYSPQLVRPLGIRVPVYPVKGYSLSIPMQNWENKPKHLMADMGLHAGINPLGGEVLRVAGTAEFTGYDKGIPKQRVDNLIGLVKTIYPEFADTMDRDNINPWAGFRPMSSDGVPIIGRTRIKGLYLNTGQGHLGWTMGAASACVLADTILGKTPKVNMDYYSINRFS